MSSILDNIEVAERPAPAPVITANFASTKKYIPFEGDYVKLPDGRIGVVAPLSSDDTVTVSFKRADPVTIARADVVAAWDCTVGPSGKPTYVKTETA